ncbi:MAG: tRNA uridine-5-carboxymethylaminomethyl modification enzyme MnmG/GidA [Planctomycetota bacterium]|jgi:tRNA uridine 5-carboxymethylaminomethyl modification enzyme
MNRHESRNRDVSIPVVLVVGGGHAGVEAARAASDVLGDAARVILLSMRPSRIGAMSCNPAIGGLAKGQMVREVDALGGFMGRAADAAGIMFRVLNASRGPAVRGPRAQCDKDHYAGEIQRLLAEETSVEVWAGTLEAIEVRGEGDERHVVAARLGKGGGPVGIDRAAIESNRSGDAPARPVFADEPRVPMPPRLEVAALVLTTGTFMRALMHTGAERAVGGRVGEGSAGRIAEDLRRLGFELGRLKTGTPPRLLRQSVDLASLPEQIGDDRPSRFSFLPESSLPNRRFPNVRQVACFETGTTAPMHDLIRANLHLAPMYAGEVEAECGPRYCPSIEDKVVRFADRDRHHVFLEPETLHCDRLYANGISTSLPLEIQSQVVRAMPGCARAEIVQAGYAVEYDMVWPHQIDATTMAKSVRGLLLAGQINGTSGYEEAAGQGVVAGLNAARFASGEALARLGRESSYIGVLLDDLVTRTPREPYRMFTSRAEHRLRLRADNADDRLVPLASEWGLLGSDRHRRVARHTEAATARRDLRSRLEATRLEGRSLWTWLRRPDCDRAWLESQLRSRLGTGFAADLRLDDEAIDRVIVEARYEAYLDRQDASDRRVAEEEHRRLPADFAAADTPGLRREASEAIRRFRPATLGQASRLAGVGPADVTLVAIALRRHAASGR